MIARTLIFVILASCAASCNTVVPVKGDINPYPAASDGETRHVIRLPERRDEASARVELLVGREMIVDCNRRWFGGKLERESVSGWGYPTWRMISVAGPATTMMACPDGQTRREFVTVRFENPFVPYNSKLPVVVYVPASYTVRYRVWSAEGKARPADVE